MTPRGTRLVVEAEPAFRTRRSNPYNARLYDRMVAHGTQVRDLSWGRMMVGRVDIVHLHWPALTFLSSERRAIVLARLLIFYGLLRVARLRGTRLVWTAHNLESHERRSTPALRRLSRRLLTRNLDAVIALTQSGVPALRGSFPELHHVPVLVVPHGHYREDYDFSSDRATARQRLDVPADVMLMVSVGQIRPYKGVPGLLRAFRGMAGPRNAELVVAGRAATPQLEREIRDAAAGDDRIRLELEFQPDNRLAMWLRAADLVVLSYTTVQNSGSAVLALSAGRPVLAPALGGLPELAALVGPGWFRLYEGDLTPADLAAAADWAVAERRGTPDLDPLSWDRLASATEEVYRLTRDRPRPRAAHGRPL